VNRAQLEHAIRAACNVSDDTELFVFGSQAILGQYPEAQDALRKFIEVDIETSKLPEAWQDRTIPVHDPMDDNNTGYCIEAHDLAASKLMAFRENRWAHTKSPQARLPPKCGGAP
jgi:hypothetical protein